MKPAKLILTLTMVAGLALPTMLAPQEAQGGWNPFAAVRRLAKRVVRSVKTAVRGARKFAGRAFRGARKFAGKALRGARKFAGKALRGAKDLAGKALRGARDLAGKAWKGFKGLLGRLPKLPGLPNLSEILALLQKAPQLIKLLPKLGPAFLSSLASIKDLALCVIKQGKMDLVNTFKLLTTNPLGFLKHVVTNVWNGVKDIAEALLDNNGAGLANITGAVLGSTVVSEADLRAAVEFVWTRFEMVGRKVGAVGCLVQFARPMKRLFQGPAIWMARFLLDQYRLLFNTVIKPKLLPLAAKVLDKGVGLVIGETWRNRLQGILARAFQADELAKKKERATKLRKFLTALASGSPNLAQSWNAAKATISTTTDFGIRKLLYIARESFKVLGEIVYDKVVEKVVDWLQGAVFSTLANVIAKVVNGLCRPNRSRLLLPAIPPSTRSHCGAPDPTATHLALPRSGRLAHGSA